MYSETDLNAIDVELGDIERRRAWMASTIIDLRARNCRTTVAERQEAQFAEMLSAIHIRRAQIEQSITEP